MTYRKPPDKCITKFCRRPKGSKTPFCSRCNLRRWRAANPIGARLAMLRDRATRKKVPFDLDYDWLKDFLETNKYDPAEHHIDREKTWLGYTKGNLQVLPMSENIAKGNRERYGKLELPF